MLYFVVPFNDPELPTRLDSKVASKATKTSRRFHLDFRNKRHFDI